MSRCGHYIRAEGGGYELAVMDCNHLNLFSDWLQNLLRQMWLRGCECQVITLDFIGKGIHSINIRPLGDKWKTGTHRNTIHWLFLRIPVWPLVPIKR